MLAGARPRVVLRSALETPAPGEEQIDGVDPPAYRLVDRRLQLSPLVSVERHGSIIADEKRNVQFRQRSAVVLVTGNVG